MDAVKPNRVALSRELSEFLVELSIAVQKHSMYPGAHPSLAAAVAGLTRRARRLLDERTTLVFGVARRQLIIDGVATIPTSRSCGDWPRGCIGITWGPSACRGGSKSTKWSRRSVRCRSRRTSTDRSASRPTDACSNGRMCGCTRSPSMASSSWASSPTGARLDKAAIGRAAELWIGLARAAMATSDRAETAPTRAAEPAVVARAIDEHQGATAYDQVIIGYLLQIARELQTAPAPKAQCCATGRRD